MIRIGNKVVAGSADVDLSTVLKSLNKTGLSIWIGTQTEHDALAESVKNNEKTTFITYDTDEDVFLIIDTIISYGKTWSSVKISSELAKKINASDVYTKEQVDEIINAKLASALKYRGAVNTTALLPASAENGDTYFVKADGFMYAYNSTTSVWDALGTVADMTNYFTKTEITAMLQDKADKFQYDVLPTASSETVGLLLQYTGADTEDYKNSYFYKGIDNGDSTYGWELAKICDCYSKSEIDDSGLCAHGDNAPFLTNSTITDYLTGLDAKYKFATFTVDQDNATVSDKVNTTQWFSYNCYRQNNSWRVTAADSSTGKEIYTTDISAGNPVSWSKLATTNAVLSSLEVKDGNVATQIIPWNDGTHYRGFEDKSNNTYTDIITKDGVANIARIENGVMTKNEQFATASDISEVNATKVPSTRINSGFKVVAYSERKAISEYKSIIECLEDWLMSALSQYNGNLVVTGNIYYNQGNNIEIVDGFATVNVWGGKTQGILGASGMLVSQQGVFYYKKINGSSESGTLTKII